jgi:hypothetical protein
MSDELYPGNVVREGAERECGGGSGGAESSFAAPTLLGCGVCGGRLVEIRGRHPSDKPRQVCPTCLAERMDMIREMSAADYGMAYEAHPNDQAMPQEERRR